MPTLEDMSTDGLTFFYFLPKQQVPPQPTGFVHPSGSIHDHPDNVAVAGRLAVLSDWSCVVVSDDYDFANRLRDHRSRSEVAE